MERRTTRGRGRKQWTTLAGLAAVAVMAMALGAAAQPGPMAAHPGMGPGAGGACMGQAAGPAMACGMGQGNCAPGHCGQGHRVRGARGQDFTQHLIQAAEKIGLSDAQKTQLRELRRRGPATLMPKRQAVMEARMDFQDLTAKQEAPANDIRKAHDKLLKAQNELRSARFDLRMQAREVLTPEQREKLHEEMRAPGHPGGGPGRMGMLDLGDEDDEIPEGEF